MECPIRIYQTCRPDNYTGEEKRTGKTENTNGQSTWHIAKSYKSNSETIPTTIGTRDLKQTNINR